MSVFDCSFPLLAQAGDIKATQMAGHAGEESRQVQKTEKQRNRNHFWKKGMEEEEKLEVVNQTYIYNLAIFLRFLSLYHCFC